jgi:Tol biopolymer transport system component
MTKRPSPRRWLRWVLLAGVAMVAAAALVHFSPRYIYSYFGDLVLKEVPGGLSEDRKKRIRQGTGDLEARVVWSSSRTGSHELYLLTLPELELYRLTDNKYVDYYSRFSPDGSRIVFARSQKPWVSERNHKPWDTYILDLASNQETLVAKNANYPQWDGPGAITFTRNSKVVRKELSSGREQVLVDAAREPLNGYPQTPELSPDGRHLAFTNRGGLRSNIVYDRKLDKLRQFSPGCELTWFPDGDSVLWVEGGGNGGNRILRSPLKPKKPETFMDLPGSHSHEYFPRLSDDGRWLVWAASAGGHEHDIADYEIFLWQVGRPWEEAVRLTMSEANDRWPDIHLKP